MFNTSLVEDDDALIQITNHGSSVNHAGFLNEKEIFALSHDESFSIYPFSDQDEATNNSPATIFGDLRSSLSCDYIVDVSISSTVEGTISAGYQGYANLPYRKSVEFLQDPQLILTVTFNLPFELFSAQHLDMIPLNFDSQQWSFSTLQKQIRLPGAHGSDLVRSIHTTVSHQPVISFHLFLLPFENCF